MKLVADDEQDENDFKLMRQTLKGGIDLGKTTPNTTAPWILYQLDQSKKLSAKAYGVDKTGHSNLPPYSGKKSAQFACFYRKFFDDMQYLKITASLGQLVVDAAVKLARPTYAA